MPPCLPASVPAVRGLPYCGLLSFRGVVCLVAVVDGQLAAGDKLAAASTGQQYDILEVLLAMSDRHFMSHFWQLFAQVVGDGVSVVCH